MHYTLNCTFTITGDNGAPITVIPPGRYQVLVTSPQPFAEIDLSGVADPTLACGGSVSFHLTGPGVTLGTTLDDGDASSDQMTANLQAGRRYAIVDDRRPAGTPHLHGAGRRREHRRWHGHDELVGVDEAHQARGRADRPCRARRR